MKKFSFTEVMEMVAEAHEEKKKDYSCSTLLQKKWKDIKKEL